MNLIAVKRCHCIYALYSGNKIFYIGCSRTVLGRIQEHQRSYKFKISYSILEDNIKSRNKALDRERYWIQKYISEGYKLNNVITGIKKEKSEKPKTHENVRISTNVLNRVRAFCDERKIKIGGFFEVAADEKLNNEKKQLA